MTWELDAEVYISHLADNPTDERTMYFKTFAPMLEAEFIGLVAPLSLLLSSSSPLLPAFVFLFLVLLLYLLFIFVLWLLLLLLLLLLMMMFINVAAADVAAAVAKQ